MTSQPWHLGRLLCLDFESSGIDPHRDRIVTAAAIEVGAGFKTVAHEFLIDPGIEIPAEATAIHGITTDEARGKGRMAKAAVKEIAELVLSCSESGVPIVGHNVGGYDLTLLWSELVRHGHQALAEKVAVIRPVIDTNVIEKSLDPYRPGKPNGRRPDAACGPHTLVACCALWGVALTEQDAHGAAADALASGRLAWRLATDPLRFSEFDGPRGVERINPAQWPLDRLHDWQQETKKAQADSFGAHLVKQGKPDDVSREWPVQSPPPGWTPEQLPEPRQEDAA